MGWSRDEQTVSLNPLHALAKVLWTMMIAVLPRPRGEAGRLGLALTEADR